MRDEIKVGEIYLTKANERVVVVAEISNFRSGCTRWIVRREGKDNKMPYKTYIANELRPLQDSKQ